MRQVEIWSRGVIAAGFDGMQAGADLPRFGVYVLFSRNIETIAQTAALTQALEQHSHDGAPAAVGIDQEGGRVMRLRDGVEPLPSMMALGAVDDVELTRRAGEQMAFDLRRAGCTLNFAPVLDLALDAGNTVIGTRSFGSDPERVAALGSTFSTALNDGGIATCAKHFPGHGATAVDSHAALPTVVTERAQLHDRDMIPFGAVARSSPAIMGAHAVFPAIDASAPATLSASAIALLRAEFGFDGAFVTDCLQMSALNSLGSVEENAITALRAGADLLIVSHDAALALRTARSIESAVETGTLDRGRLEQAYQRVLRLRTSARSGSMAPSDFAPHPGVGREIARRAVTLIRGASRVDATSATIVSFEGNACEGINLTGRDAPSLTHESPVLHELRLPLDPSAAQIDATLRALRESGRRSVALTRRAHLHPQQSRAVDAIVGAYADAVVVSMLEPFDVPLFSGARTLLATYGDDRAAIGGLADVLFGGSVPEGRLPVRLCL